METRRPLLICDSSEITDDILRLAAATGVDIHMAVDAESARAQWSAAPMVLIGADRLAEVTRLPRRRDVIVVTRQPAIPSAEGAGSGVRTVPDAIWREAIAIGAEHVITLPDAERWLIDRLADCGHGPSRQGQVICVVGACGGAGSSTFAAVLSSVAVAQGRRTLLIDTDQTGGGLDLTLGAELLPGARWADIADARGRVSPATLDDALPHPGGLALLSFGRQWAGPLLSESLSSIVDAGVRGYDSVIIDLVRALDPLAAVARAKATSSFLIIPNRLRSVAAAAALIPALDFSSPPTLLLRKVARGLAISDVERAIGHRVHLVLPEDPSIGQEGEHGHIPGLRSEYGQVCARALEQITPMASAA